MEFPGHCRAFAGFFLLQQNSVGRLMVKHLQQHCVSYSISFQAGLRRPRSVRQEASSL